MLLLATGGAVLVGAAACSADAAAPGGRISVVAAFYPLQYVADRVGGDAVAVTNLAKPGAEPHDLELEPQQVRQVADAQLVVYLKGFQPAVDETVAQEAKDRTFDAAAVAPLRDAAPADEPPGEEPPAGNKDLHVWLDPARLAVIGDRLADRLGEVDNAHAAEYRTRAAALHAELDQLGTEYATRLANCERREIVTSHAAFGYLAERFQLTQIAVSGLTPETEPSPQRLAAVAEQARAYHATTIFFETLASPRVAEAIAREVGAKTAVLDPIEGLEPGSTDDYVSVMRSNLTSLTAALGCT